MPPIKIQAMTHLLRSQAGSACRSRATAKTRPVDSGAGGAHRHEFSIIYMFLDHHSCALIGVTVAAIGVHGSSSLG